jgi:hypothetical protein
MTTKALKEYEGFVANESADEGDDGYDELGSITVSGFDPEGEPEIRFLRNGSLNVMVEYMPPSYADGDMEDFEEFDKEMEEAIGTKVSWDDRESFFINDYDAETVERLRAFLATYRQKKAEQD